MCFLYKTCLSDALLSCFFVSVRMIELFKWKVSTLLSDKHDWPVFLDLLGISSMVQRDISKHCFAHRCYYEIVDAFECGAIQQDYARTPERLLEKLQQKLPDLREELAGCLKAAQSFEIPTLSKYGIYVDIMHINYYSGLQRM